MSSIDPETNDIEINIIFSDEHFYCVDKPAGLPSIGREENTDSVVGRLYDEFGEHGLELPHRIDQPTHGLQLVARTSEANKGLMALFRERKVRKEYRAAVEGVTPEHGTLKNRLIRDGAANRSRVTQSQKLGKLAVLSFRKLKQTDRYSLIEVFPETGRHHQIRVQFQAIGHPIKGDIKYGARRGNRDRSIHLIAHRLRFEHPVTGAPMDLVANPRQGPIWDLWPQE